MVDSLALLRDVTLQSCSVGGPISNTDEHSVSDWVDLVGDLVPSAVQIYTIDRQPAISDARPVSGAQLEEIACLLRSRTGIDARITV